MYCFTLEFDYIVAFDVIFVRFKLCWNFYWNNAQVHNDFA